MKFFKNALFAFGLIAFLNSCDKEVTAPKGRIEYEYTLNNGEQHGGTQNGEGYISGGELTIFWRSGVETMFLNIPIGTNSPSNKIEKEYTIDCEPPSATKPIGTNQHSFSIFEYLSGNRLFITNFLVYNPAYSNSNTGSSAPESSENLIIGSQLIGANYKITSFKKKKNTVSGTFTILLQRHFSLNKYVVTGSFNEIPLGPEVPNDVLVSGDANGNGFLDPGEIVGDCNKNGVIDGNEIAGDANCSGTIVSPEKAGDVNGDGVINGNEITGDVNGNNQIDTGEVEGDTNGDGTINGSENPGTPPSQAGPIKFVSTFTGGDANTSFFGQFFTTSTPYIDSYYQTGSIPYSNLVDFVYNDVNIREIGSPNDVNFKTNYYANVFPNYTTYLDTRFLVTNILAADFDTMTTDLGFKDITGITNTSTTYSGTLQEGAVIAFETVNNKKGLIKLSFMSVEPSITIKVQQ